MTGPNADIAERLEEIAALLTAQRANPFRVRAYRRAAATIRDLRIGISQILAREGVAGLERLPNVGPSLARTIRDIAAHGYSPMLERIRGGTDPVHVFVSVPGIGPRLADRLHDELGLETLQDLEAAAHDGRLEQIAGFGAKRLAGIRATLAQRLGRLRVDDPSAADHPPPPVAELLDVDAEYLRKCRAGELPRIAPRRFNPDAVAWLPILHTERGARHYTALFSNTARAHRLAKTDDWVVLYCDDGARDGQWTVVTAEFGSLRGRRIVTGREPECEAAYGSSVALGDETPRPART